MIMGVWGEGMNDQELVVEVLGSEVNLGRGFTGFSDFEVHGFGLEFDRWIVGGGGGLFNQGVGVEVHGMGIKYPRFRGCKILRFTD